jgi:hypothetical protein
LPPPAARFGECGRPCALGSAKYFEQCHLVADATEGDALRDANGVYDVAPERVRHDLVRLVEELKAKGLIEAG